MNYQLHLQFLLIFQIKIFVTAHFRECLTPLSDVGQCVSLKYCPEVLLLYQKLPPDQATKYSTILKSICGNQVTFDAYPIVCCRVPKFQQDQQTEYELIPVWIQNPNAMTSTTEQPIPTESPKIQIDKEPKKPCLGLKNEIGFCQSLETCAELFDAIRDNPSNETIKDYLRYSHKTCDSIGTDVCCPSMTKRKITAPYNEPDAKVLSFPLTEDEGCGRDHHILLKKVIGGQESEIGSWPWIALLGYNPYSKNPFRCGGTLITARHVLTAAHCILSDLSFVRLGEHDLSIEDDTTYVDVNIAKAIIHEKYSKIQMRFDIALLYLERNVEFTDTIYPICLPMSAELRKKSYVSYTPFAAGWGRTSTEDTTTSNVLHEVQLFVHENQVCQDAFTLALRAKGRRQLSNSSFDDSILCVGDLMGKKDTCKGDSGGPLMVPESYKGVQRYYLIGVTSYGISCAKPGVPAIYTSTQYFMDWILQKIQET